MTTQLHMIKIVLSQCLVEHDGYGIGQIQGTDLGKHRDTDAGLFMLYEDLFGDSGAFLAEQQDIVGLEGEICQRCGAPGGEQDQAARWAVAQEGVPVGVPRHVAERAVVQRRALHGAVGARQRRAARLRFGFPGGIGRSASRPARRSDASGRARCARGWLDARPAPQRGRGAARGAGDFV